MCHIKEPDGVDLLIKSRPLTEDEENAISNFIRSYKVKYSHRKVLSKRIAKRKIVA